WISVGGLLGGIFNSLIAPVIFSTVLEYPLILIIGALLLPAGSKKRLTGMRKWKDILIYSGAPLVLVALTYWLRAGEHMPHKNLPWSPYLLVVALCGIILLLCYGLIYLKRHFLFGIGIAAVLLTIAAAEGFRQNIVHRERSFFGILTVARSIDGRFMSLYHGTTRHGIQWLNPSNPSNRIEPLAYYHWQGPVGHVFWEFGGQKKKSRIAVAGLGTGSLASYAGPGQEIDFYEIDPAVKKIATNSLYFSFLTECAADWKIIMGDARLTMEKAPPNYYGIIILDAFNSDAIPVHLLTREAMNLYFSKLNEDGILMIHISNNYVNLAPVLARLADEKGFADRLCHDFENEKIGKLGATWVLLARKETDLGGLTRSNLWTKIKRQKNVNVWTDDFSNVFSVFKW
ncbi:MAG: fused MFS/spermidine synthase, partial [Bacteroidia bacterium]|nr:fused MFS/spermidine synthase [Bacteroidia bacterium]